MNELPAIGHLCLREELWDRQGPNIASRQKEMYGEKLFRGIRKRFFETDQRFLAAVFYREWIQATPIRGICKSPLDQS